MSQLKRFDTHQKEPFFLLDRWIDDEDLWPPVGAKTPPVRIYGPDMTLRSVLSAVEFRRRYPIRVL